VDAILGAEFGCRIDLKSLNPVLGSFFGYKQSANHHGVNPICLLGMLRAYRLLGVCHRKTVRLYGQLLKQFVRY